MVPSTAIRASPIRLVVSVGVLAYVACVLAAGSPGRAAFAFLSSMVGLFLAGWALATMTRLERLRRALWLYRLDVVCFNAALTLVLIEASLFSLGHAAGGGLLVQHHIDTYRLEPSRNYGRLWTNRWGYPSREFVLVPDASTRPVVLLGDSFAVGSVRQDANFASQIEAIEPSIEVYNFGVHATGPREYLLILTGEALRFVPDVVIVAFFVGNDVSQAPVGGGGAFVVESHRTFLFMRRAWRVGREWYRRRSAGLDPALELPQLSHPPVPQEGFNLTPESHREIELERLAITRTSLRRWYEDDWERTFEHLGRIDEAARAAGAATGIVVIPDEFQTNPDLLEEIVRFGNVPRDDIDLDSPQRRIRAFCVEAGIPCLDLKELFAGTSDTYLPRDTHWNEKGNRIAAEAIARWLGREF